MVDYAGEASVKEAIDTLLAVGPREVAMAMQEINMVSKLLARLGLNRAGMLLTGAGADLGAEAEKKADEWAKEGKLERRYILAHFIELDEEDYVLQKAAKIHLKTYIVAKLVDHLKEITLVDLADKCNNHTVHVKRTGERRFLVVLEVSADDYAIAQGILTGVDPEQKMWSIYNEQDEV